MPLDIHAIPAFLDAMALIGFTLPEAAVALRAAIAAHDREETHALEQAERGHVQAPSAPEAAPAIAPATSSNAAPAVSAATPAWQRRREILRKHGLPANSRGRLADLVPAIAPAIAPLSPIVVINLDQEERADVARAIAPATPAGAHPLPADWQPSAGRRLAAVKAGGEIGAANLIAKFCNHFHARAHEIRTAAGWQGRFSNWIITEWPAGKEPQLPLMRPMPTAAPPPDDKWEAIKRRVHAAVPRRESG